MGPIKLDPKIVGQMKVWGGNYNSTVGDNHCTVADKVDQQIDSKQVTLNIMSKMDASHAKPSNMNPGVDRGFVIGKGSPVMDTTGHGKLTKSLQD
jgi:hypothetical protein